MKPSLLSWFNFFPYRKNFTFDSVNLQRSLWSQSIFLTIFKIITVWYISFEIFWWKCIKLILKITKFQHNYGSYVWKADLIYMNRIRLGNGYQRDPVMLHSQVMSELSVSGSERALLRRSSRLPMTAPLHVSDYSKFIPISKSQGGA